MIELLYTGAPKQFKEQIEPLFSLGKLMSSSQVANDFYGNLFPEVTLSTVQNNSVDHICLALRANSPVTDLTFTLITLRSNIGRFRIGSVSVNKDDCDVYNLPSIQNTQSKPVNICFHNCTSFYGESLIGFTISPNLGETFELNDNGGLIGTIIYDPKFENVWIDPIRQEEYVFQSRYNQQTKMFELFLIQKSLTNFNTLLELIRVSDSVDVGNIQDTLPELNCVSLGDVNQNVLALFLERTLSNEYLRQNRNLNCEKLFDEFELGIEPETTELVKMEIEYEATQQE